jgi:hypothetical protein
LSLSNSLINSVERRTSMASRNLTKKFLEIRNAAKANRGISDHFDEGDKGLLKVLVRFVLMIAVILLVLERF